MGSPEANAASTDAAIVLTSGALSEVEGASAEIGKVALRCFAEPVSIFSFFDREDLEIRDAEVISAGPDSGAAVTTSSAFLRVFFEVLFDCMEFIVASEKQLCQYLF